MKTKNNVADILVSGGFLGAFAISRKNAILLAAGLFCIEAAALKTAWKDVDLATAVFQLTFAFNSLIGMLIGVRLLRRSSHLKAHWSLLVLVNVFVITSNIWDTWSRYVFRQAPSTLVVSGRDLLYLSAYIPIFLLLSLPAGRRYFRHFIWIDLFQVGLAAYLLYSLLFHALPFVQPPAMGMSGVSFYRLGELLNFIICAGLLLHFVAAVDADEMRFFRYKFFFTLLIAILFVINTEVSLRNPEEIWTNILQYAAAIVSSYFYLRYPAESAEPERRHSASLAADLINIASPALPSAALLTLAIAVQPRYPRVGTASVVIAFLLFAIRSTFYQRSFERTQKSLESARDHLAHISMVDELTGIANRRAFDQAFTQEWERSTRAGSALSVILIDVDYFKQLNDRFGHQAGDACLAAIAQALQSALPRSIDLVGRYGGDEFAVILPSTGSVDAEMVAEKLMHAVAELTVDNPATASGYATVSIGVGSCEHADGFTARNPKQLLRIADEALYRAKASGRNGWQSGRFGPADNFTIAGEVGGLERA